MLITELVQAVNGPPSASHERRALVRFEMRPASDHVEIVGSVTPEWAVNGSLPPPAADEGYASVRLHTTGLRWLERDGPTRLLADWLVWAFPDLPANGVEGSWEITRPDGRAIVRTEVDRSGHPSEKRLALDGSETTSTAPPEKAFTVRVEHRTKIAETDALELSLRRTESSESRGKSRQETSDGAFVVLASGRLLGATLKTDWEEDTEPPGSERVHVIGHRTREVHLVRACDGPTAAPLADPPSAERRAIRAWNEVSVALAKRELSNIAAAFAPSVREKHGDAAIAEALRTFLALRGPEALPQLTLLHPEDVDREGESVKIRIHGRLGPMDVFVPLTIVLRENAGRWLVTAIDGGSALHLSDARISVGVGWPPR